MSISALSWLTCPLSCPAVSGGRPFLRQQRVDPLQVRREFRRIDAVVHLGREQVGAVVAEAPLALKLDHRQRLQRVHAEVGEVLDAAEDVEELRRFGTAVVAPSSRA